VEKLVQKDIPRLENPMPAAPAPAPKPGTTPKSSPRHEDRAPKRKRSNRTEAHEAARSVVGMGDHMPSFIALSFEERKAV